MQLAEQTALLEHDALHRMGIADEDLPHASIPVAVNHDSPETRFPEAALSFARQTGTTLDLRSEDQTTRWRCCAVARCWGGDHAGRAGAGLPDPCAGQHPLCGHVHAGVPRPLLCEGVNAQSLAHAPVLVFNRKDDMQARFARRLAGDDLPMTAPTGGCRRRGRSCRPTWAGWAGR